MRFFSLSRLHFRSFLSLLESFRGILVVFEGPGPSNVHPLEFFAVERCRLAQGGVVREVRVALGAHRQPPPLGQVMVEQRSPREAKSEQGGGRKKKAKFRVVQRRSVRQPTEAEEKPVDETRQRVFQAIVGKAQWILRARLDVLYAVKELSRRMQGPREVDHVAAKRMAKYFCGTRDTVLQITPRKGTLRLDSASDSDWARWPTSRKSSSGAMV